MKWWERTESHCGRRDVTALFWLLNYAPVGGGERNCTVEQRLMKPRWPLSRRRREMAARTGDAPVFPP